MNLNHVVISGWVVANIDSYNATERANAFRDACQKRPVTPRLMLLLRMGLMAQRRFCLW